MNKDNNKLTERQQEARQRRKVLSSISRKARLLRELKPEFEDCTINEILMATIYNPSGELEFKKFREWKAEGYTIKKGEKGFMLWAQPLKAQKEESEAPTEPQNEADENSDFFPVCYLFSNEQVIKPQPKEKLPQPQRQVQNTPDLPL